MCLVSIIRYPLPFANNDKSGISPFHHINVFVIHVDKHGAGR